MEAGAPEQVHAKVPLVFKNRLYKYFMRKEMQQHLLDLKDLPNASWRQTQTIKMTVFLQICTFKCDFHGTF